MHVPSRLIQNLCPKYPRPAKLSDPGCDFSPEELEALIRKPDAELTETDLTNNPLLADESIYYDEGKNKLIR